MAAITVSDLRGRWAARRPACGVWSRLPGVVTAELLARSCPDYVVFDLQHGALDEADLPGVAAAVVAVGAVPLVRTRSAHVADIDDLHALCPGMQTVRSDKKRDAIAPGHAEGRDHQRDFLAGVAVFRQAAQRVVHIA